MKLILITNFKEKLTYHKNNLPVVVSVAIFASKLHAFLKHFEWASIELFLAGSYILVLDHACGLIKRLYS